MREVYVKGPGLIFKGNPKNYLTEIQLPFKDWTGDHNADCRKMVCARTFSHFVGINEMVKTRLSWGMVGI
jgi:hypothetical protein